MMLIGLAGVAAQSNGAAAQAPRFWNDRELAEWAIPIAALDVRPSHYSVREYYAAPEAEWVRTYPVYFPGQEPAGYWEMLRGKKPEPLVARARRPKPGGSRIRSNRRRTRTPVIRARPPDAQSFRGKAARAAMRHRLRQDFVPSGFVGQKVTRRAVPGHEFGLRLTPEDKSALIAFLKTL